MSEFATTNERDARALRNEALFRSVNQRIETLNEVFSAILPESGDWVCECADERCIERIEMSMPEYRALRATPNWFVIVPSDDHVWPSVEKVVRRTAGYWIVEKSAQAVSEALGER